MTTDQAEDRADVFRNVLRISTLRALPSREVLLHAARFERVEPAFLGRYGDQFQKLRIGILASLSSQHLCSVLKLFLYAEGLAPTINASEFDGIATEGLDQSAPVWSFKPQELVVLPATEDIKSWPRMFASESEIDRWVQHQAQPYLLIWQSAAQQIPDCRIYHALFVPPLTRPLGNLERFYHFSRGQCIARLNEYLILHRPANVTLVDLDYLSAFVGRQAWFDEAAFFLTKQPLSLRELPLLCAYLARLIAAGRGFVRKCLVVDLDNTLWGGVIGDDGIFGIRIGPSEAVGEAFLAFQHYLHALKERGVLLAVCSKNDEETARGPFLEHSDMLLRLEDFAAFVVNWDDKITNIRRISQQLNIGIDALVFFDDNPAERAIVEQFEPSVQVINVPNDPAQFIRALEMSFAFEWPQLTAEDAARTKSYVHERKRQEIQAQFADYNSYLQSLDMKCELEITGVESLPRVSQLINKTNQFNLRTRRYSEQELAALMSSEDHILLQARLVDRFTNYGIVASAILRFVGDIAFVENWVMSCRAFKRGLEDATLNVIVELAKARGANHIVGEYVATPKNGYVANFFDQLGWEQWKLEVPAWLPKLGALYRLPVAAAVPRSHFIEIMKKA